MKYALLLMGRSGDPDCGETGGADPSEFMAFDKEITEAGVVVGGFALDGPECGGRGSESDGGSIVTTGPSAASNDSVGGSYVIETAHLDEASGWATKWPGVGRGRLGDRGRGQRRGERVDEAVARGERWPYRDPPGRRLLMDADPEPAVQTLSDVGQEDRGRLLAALAHRFRDFDLAEEALHDA